ncbi:peroxiredoxin family protein [Parasphingorhabdus sp.]|uniref:peroxiredoxin family protein n=1 Tax=Parasphingorhabdus sp. TaxID=2709688 RepID=UPI003002C068
MKQTGLLFSTFGLIALHGCSEPASTEPTANTEQVEKTAETIVMPISEADSIDAGLAVGKQVPVAASVLLDGKTVTIGEILEKGPALFVLTRSVEWCPYCQTQLKSINAIVGDLEQRGYTLYGLSYDSPDQQDRFSMNQMLTYDMLSDQTSTVIDALGLRDPQYTEGRAAGVPYASVLIVDKNGTIIAKSVSGDYKKRPSNDQILALVDSI